MATILIVDDRPVNREFLVTLLGYGGHRLLEARDGAEGLSVTWAERPDLVIADILMPTMDGYEFVRCMRSEPAIADTRVIYYTAHYHEVEARRLATACGVFAVLTKPCEPELMLRTVEAALGHVQPPVSAPPEIEFDREHLKVLTDKLSDKADELRRSNERLTALVELGMRLGSERDPAKLLQVLCDSAREIIGARYAVVGIQNGGTTTYKHLCTSGMDVTTAVRVKGSSPVTGMLGSVLTAGRCFRTANLISLDASGVPATFPAACALLAAPLHSPAIVYGWICLLDKIGGDNFTEEDERLAGMLGAQVGRIYENGSLYYELLQHATKLVEEVAERKRAEEEARRSTELLRAVTDGTTDAVFVKDRQCKYLLINEAGSRFVGKSVEEILGKDDTNIFGSDDAHRIMAVSLSVMESGNVKTAEEVATAVGVTRTYHVTQAPYRDAKGKVIGVIGIARDITERKRAEVELQASGQRFRELGDAIPQIVWISGPDGGLTHLNAKATEYTGVGIDDLKGWSWDKVIHPDDLSSIVEQWTGILISGNPRDIEFRIRRTDGQYRWHITRQVPTRDPAGAIVTWYGTCTDIEDLKRYAEALQHSERRLQYVLTSSPTVLFTLSVVGDQIRGISWISDNLRGLLGYSPKEALHPDWWPGNIHLDSRERVMVQTREDLFARGYATHEYRFRHRDGQYRWTHGEIRMIRDAVGQPVEAVGSWSDITERKRLEDQFHQAQKMEAVGRLAGGVAHDFNNLLTVINGYGEILLGSMPPSDPNRDLIQEMVNAGERATGLTRQLLAFSRKAIIEPKSMNLKSVVVELKRMLKRIVGEDIDFAIASDPDAGLVKADPGQIEQVILNLVVNARDAMPVGGRLTIEVRNTVLDATYTATQPEARPGEHVLLAVSDTGSGMDAATITRVFEPFFSTKGEHGTGLGLATVHGIVKQAGGHVAVYSELGIGTTFKVYLPRTEQQPGVKGATVASTSAPKGSETVLLVEDEDTVRALTRHILRNCGYMVLEARDGAEAMRHAIEYRKRIDLLVTDVVMPRMGGREVAKRIAEIHEGIKVLFLSGYTDDAIVRHGILEAEVAFLQKPFTPLSLAAKVREVIDQK